MYAFLNKLLFVCLKVVSSDGGPREGLEVGPHSGEDFPTAASEKNSNIFKQNSEKNSNILQQNWTSSGDSTDRDKITSDEKLTSVPNDAIESQSNVKDQENLKNSPEELYSMTNSVIPLEVAVILAKQLCDIVVKPAKPQIIKSRPGSRATSSSSDKSDVFPKFTNSLR